MTRKVPNNQLLKFRIPQRDYLKFLNEQPEIKNTIPYKALVYHIGIDDAHTYIYAKWTELKEVPTQSGVKQKVAVKFAEKLEFKKFYDFAQSYFKNDLDAIQHYQDQDNMNCNFRFGKVQGGDAYQLTVTCDPNNLTDAETDFEVDTELE